MLPSSITDLYSVIYPWLHAITSFSATVFLILMVTWLLVFKYKAVFHINNFWGASSSSKEKKRALAELRVMRENGLRDGERVIDIWETFLSQDSNLRHEKWVIMEQVFIAALDVGDDQLACECLSQLRAHFKKSSRVNRLFGMYLEANGRFDDAQAVYAQLLKDDQTNTFVRKRKIAILKAQRRNIEAIDELRNYLKTFMSDFEAWSELADLYLAECDFKHAAFCLEEMLLSSPHNHLYCQRYAEIKYTEGGIENLEVARAYFSQACYLNPKNVRSLYGLLLTCSALDRQSGRPSLDFISVSQSVSTSANRDSIDSLVGSMGSRNRTSAAKSPSGSSGDPELNRRLLLWSASKLQQLYENTLESMPCSLLCTKGQSVHQSYKDNMSQPSVHDPSLRSSVDRNIATEENTDLSDHRQSSIRHFGSLHSSLSSDS